MLADCAEPEGEVDVSHAEAALKRAQERLSLPSTAGIDVARALTTMKRAEARIAAAKLQKAR